LNLERARSFGWQGGGLYIVGTATLTNTNVYSNTARYVCSPSALAQTFPPSPYGWRSLTVLSGSQGGGVSVWSSGVANFEGCNIHDNIADDVCLHLELALNFLPVPQWRLTLLSRLAGRGYRHLWHGDADQHQRVF
jgi:hypothetical protein